MKMSDFIGKRVKEICREEPLHGTYALLVIFEDNSCIYVNEEENPFFDPKGEYAESDVPFIPWSEFAKKLA